jgi:hypothetical protein
VVHQLFHFTDWTGSRETLIAVGNAIRAFPPAQISTRCRRAVGAAESMETCSFMISAPLADATGGGGKRRKCRLKRLYPVISVTVMAAEFGEYSVSGYFMEDVP